MSFGAPFGTIYCRGHGHMIGRVVRFQHHAHAGMELLGHPAQHAERVAFVAGRFQPTDLLLRGLYPLSQLFLRQPRPPTKRRNLYETLANKSIFMPEHPAGNCIYIIVARDPIVATPYLQTGYQHRGLPVPPTRCWVHLFSTSWPKQTASRRHVIDTGPCSRILLSYTWTVVDENPVRPGRL